MKSFFKDYWELCEESNKWMKKHWKGYLVLCFIVSLIYLAPYIVELSKVKKRDLRTISQKRRIRNASFNCSSWGIIHIFSIKIF